MTFVLLLQRSVVKTSLTGRTGFFQTQSSPLLNAGRGKTWSSRTSSTKTSWSVVIIEQQKHRMKSIMKFDWEINSATRQNDQEAAWGGNSFLSLAASPWQFSSDLPGNYVCFFCHFCETCFGKKWVCFSRAWLGLDWTHSLRWHVDDMLTPRKREDTGLLSETVRVTNIE